MYHFAGRATFAAVILFFASIFNNGAARAESLVVAGWVGPYETALRKEFFPAFEKKYGAKIEYLSASSFVNYGRIKAERNNPQVDVVLIDDMILDQARKDDLLAPLDTKIVTHLDDMSKDARFKDNMGIGIGYNVVSMYYNAKIFQDKGFAAPTSWNDLFRPELKGHVVIRNITSSYGLYPLLMFARINGGSDINVDPGFAKMKELAPNVISFPTSHGPQAQMTLQGEAWIGVTGLGEFQDFVDKKAPVKFLIPKEGAIAMVESAGVVKGAPHGKLAQQFINELTSPNGQRLMAIALSYLPTNDKTPIDDQVRARLPLDFSERGNLKTVDFDAVMANREKWNERFNKDIARQ